MALCICPHTDPYECWRIRYNIADTEVDADGGPCSCVCHEGEDDDED